MQIDRKLANSGGQNACAMTPAAQSGILTEDDWVELIRGEIVEMTPIGRRHAACVKVFTQRLGDRMIFSPQNPVELDNNSDAPMQDIR